MKKEDGKMLWKKAKGNVQGDSSEEEEEGDLMLRSPKSEDTLRMPGKGKKGSR
jgi:hypothetical protein